MVDINVDGKWQISVEATLSSAHALRHYEGKCERLHGHNFEILAEVEGNKLEEKTGILIDFKILRSLLNQILAPFDHQFINKIAPFDKINPSSENIARYVAESLQQLLTRLYPEKSSLKVSKIIVSEKKGQSAAWLPD